MDATDIMGSSTPESPNLSKIFQQSRRVVEARKVASGIVVY
jgi:hypothetical protein